MNNHNQTVNRIESFLEDYQVEGICGFIVDSDFADNSNIQVIVILDLKWLEARMTKPEFVAKRMRQGVKSEIQKWLGLDIYVGSTARKCH